MKFLYGFAAASVLFLFSCANLNEMSELKTQIEHKYHFEHVLVDLNNNTNLKVSLVNTSYNDSSKESKQQLATAIGVMTPLYMKSGHITKGEVLFVKGESNLIANVSLSESFDMGIGK